MHLAIRTRNRCSIFTMRINVYLDTNAYKQRLVRLSQKIRDFKESCQLQTLSQEQTTLESELREFESNLHKYESATGSKPTSATSSNKENKKCNDYKGIQDFHALIAKTGTRHICIRLRIIN